MRPCQCADRCECCGGYSDRFVQLTSPPPNLVCERTELDDVVVVEPVVAVALDGIGDVCLLAVDAEGFVHSVDWCAKSVWVRERHPGEELGVK